MSIRGMSVFVGGQGLISINLRRAYVTLLHHLLLKQHQEGSCLLAIFFRSVTRIQARS